MPLLAANDYFDRAKKHSHSALECPKCSAVLNEMKTGIRPMGDGRLLCSDCHYEELAISVEAFPILPPRIRKA